jgi:hypothetical protein
VVPLFFAASAMRGRASSSRVVRLWALIGLLFFLWALGPHLTVFGQNTGMILPQSLMRYVPVVNNARIPGRAIVVVYLALAMLAAIGIASWRARSRRRVLVTTAVALAVLVDFMPGPPFPIVTLDSPALYQTLRAREEPGAVCELPMGIRDGFGETGAFDERVLLYQTVHQRPVVGGYISRLPSHVTAAYTTDPLLAGLLSLSANGEREPSPLPDRATASRRLRANGIKFIVLNRDRAKADLIDYVEHVLPLALIAQEDSRSLYIVAD